MELHRKVATVAAAGAVAAGYVAARAATKWVTDTLASIDGAFDIDFDDRPDESEPCVCGSTEHTSSQAIYTLTSAILDNGKFGPMPITASFGYFETDPLAVTMTLTLSVQFASGRVGRDQQTWTYARDILDTAVSTTSLAGEGDVTAKYEPHSDTLSIWLTDTEGDKHRIELEAEPVREFLVNTYGLVPGGQEHPDVDGAIEHLLEGTVE